MQLKESGEMYLETIYVLSQKSSYVRAIDVGEKMGYSKPSVITVGTDGSLNLTALGKEIASKTYERHTVLTKLFTKLGVSLDTAAADACKIEHVISDETFVALKEHLKGFE